MQRVLVLLLGSVLLTGCVDRQLPTFIAEPVVGPNPNQAAPLTGVLTFEADEPVTTRITVSDGEQSFHLDFDATAVPSSGLPIVGLKPGMDYTVTVAIQDASGNLATYGTGLSFKTPSLSEDPSFFPPIQVDKTTPDQMEPGVTLLSMRRVSTGPMSPEERRAIALNYGMLLALDNNGDVVWCYLSDYQISDFERLPNGNFIFITYDHRIVEIDLLGNVQREWYASRHPSRSFAEETIAGTAVAASSFHHEVDLTPTGTLVVLSSEVREIDNFYTSETDPAAPRAQQLVAGDVITEFEPETGEILWSWSAFDHLDTERIGYGTFGQYWTLRGFPEARDWTHGTGLDYNEADDTYLVSLRNMDALIAIDGASGEVKWILGENEDWSPELEAKVLAPAGEVDWPWHAYAPSFTPEGNILIFNNRSYLARPFEQDQPWAEKYSSAVEYEVDLEARTLKQVWTSEVLGDDNVVSQAMGDADWMPQTGNVLVSYGLARSRPEAFGLEGTWTRIREYTRTDPPEILMDIAFIPSDTTQPPPVNWIIFGSDRISSLHP